MTEQLNSLLGLLSNEQKKELKSAYRRSTNTGEKLIYLLLSGEPLSKLNIAATALTKAEQQSAELLTSYIQRHVQSTYDEVEVLKILAEKKNYKAAQAMYTRLEKQYAQLQQWQVLDELYSTALTPGFIFTKAEDLTAIAERRSKLADDIYAYAKLHSNIVIEQANDKHQLSKLQKLNKRAYDLGHHSLIHLSLVMLYNYYNHHNEPAAQAEIVSNIQANRKKFAAAMHPEADAISRYCAVDFYCRHEGYGSPETHIGEAWKRIDHAGNHAKIELIHSLLSYYLCEGKADKAHYYLKEMEKTVDKKSFAPFKSMIMAITSFFENNYTGFKLNIDMFYNDHAKVNSPALEAMMRIMELLILKHDKEEKALATKHAALQLFIEQNLPKERHTETYDIVAFIGNPKNKAKLETLKQSKYRSSRILVAYVLKEFK